MPRNYGPFSKGHFEIAIFERAPGQDDQFMGTMYGAKTQEEAMTMVSAAGLGYVPNNAEFAFNGQETVINVYVDPDNA